MALLDFMKQGTQWLTDNTGMDWNKVQSDPGLAAKRLMGGPVDLSSQQGTGFNFFGGNNASQNAQEPLPRMDVTGTVGGPSMTPYQGQEVGPSHLGVTNIDRTNNYSAELQGGGSFNQYYGEDEEIWNPETLSYDPAVRGARKNIYSNPEATYTAEQMPNSMQSDGSVAKVDMNSLNKQSVPAYDTNSNVVWDEELQRYVPVTENNAVQQPTSYNPDANINTGMYPTNLLGTGNELVGPTQVNGGGASAADGKAEADAVQLNEERTKEHELIDAKSYDPYYIDYGGYFGGPGMSSVGDGSEAKLEQFYKTKDVVGPNAGGFTDYPGEIGNWFNNLFNSSGTGTEDRTFAGGEEVKVDYDPNNQSDYNLKKEREIVNQIMSKDVTDEEKRQLFESAGINPYEYLKEGLISKK